MSTGQRKFHGDPSQPLRFDNSQAGMVSQGAGAKSFSVQIDMREACRKLGIAFETMGEEIKVRALVHTLNRACKPVLTQVRRAVASQTSIPYGRVMSRIKDKPAHVNRLEYRIEAKDGAIPLIEFKVSGAMGFAPTVRVWKKQRKLKGAFIIRGRYGEGIVKRIGKHAGGIGSKAKDRKGPLNVKTLWGPIIPKEMIRPGFESRAVLERVQQRVEARLPHELEQAAIRAKARSGT